MPITLNKNSLLKLKGVHPSLVSITNLAAQKSDVVFIITCGIRTLAVQKVLVATGKSKTMNSKHLAQKDGFSHAVDFCPLDEKGNLDWDDNEKRFTHVANAFKAAASELNHKITWGGDWRGGWDKPHIQIEI